MDALRAQGLVDLPLPCFRTELRGFLPNHDLVVGPARFVLERKIEREEEGVHLECRARRVTDGRRLVLD